MSMGSKQCPFCKQWITLPIRRDQEAFEKHKKQCDPVGYARQQEAKRELLGGDAPDLLAPPEEMDDATRQAVRADMLGVTSDEERDLVRQESEERITQFMEEMRVLEEPEGHTPATRNIAAATDEASFSVGLYTIYLSEDERARVGAYMGRKGPATKEQIREFAYDAIAKALQELQ